MKRLFFFLTLTIFVHQSSFSQWTQVDLSSENLFDVFFNNETTGWVVGNNTILKTTDAGENWIPKDHIVNTRYYGVHFKDELNGWAVGKSTSGTAGRIHYTTNGGNTWLAYQTGGSLPWWSIDFANDNQGVIVGQEGQIKYTSDGGSTWSNRNSPSGDAGIIKDVTFYDGLNGIAVGYSTPSVGFIMKTSDGGNSWINIDIAVTGGLEAVSFRDNTEGVIVGRAGVIYRTIDGGNTWTARNSNTTQNLNGVHYYDGTNVIAVGGAGTIVQSNSLGLDWEVQESNTASTLRSVFKNNLNTAFAVGSLGKIIKYCNECNSMSVFNIDYQMTETAELQIEDLSIAADNSASTLFRFSGTNFQNSSIRIKEDENQEEVELWGSFNDGEIINNAYLEVLYTHPQYFNSQNQQQNIDATIQVIDNQTMDVIVEYPIKIVRPSVLMVHGIWSNGNSFSSMENALLQANMYTPNQLLRMNYIGDISNYENVSRFYLEKKWLIDVSIGNNISLGKIDILGHSNGGLLSRLYIQSDQYENDVNKLITLNTPHSGSQMANLLLDPNFSFLHYPLEFVGKNSTNGIITGLKVDGTFIQQLNGLSSQQFSETYNEIGLHTISSTETVDNLVGNWDALIVNCLKFHVEEAIDYYIENTIFQNPNHDVIVAQESQIAGISATTPFPNQIHTGSTTNSLIQNKVIELLNQSPINPTYFSLTGYNPAELTTNFNSQRNQPQNETNETLTISNPIEGTQYNAGEDVTIDINGSTGIENIVSSMGNAILPIQNHVIENASTGSFNFTIPNNALGRLEIVSVGFDVNGYAGFDTTYIIVNTDAVLESIEVVQSLIYVPEGRSSIITILGHYDDGETRNITNVDELMYAFDTQNAEIIENGLVNGLIEGEDMLTVTYLDKTTTVPITIANASEWIEVTLSNPEISNNDHVISLFPNPTKEILNINVSNTTSQVNITIYDTTGQLILTKTLHRAVNHIDISQLQSSLYFIKIEANNMTTTKRFIKQ